MQITKIRGLLLTVDEKVAQKEGNQAQPRYYKAGGKDIQQGAL